MTWTCTNVFRGYHLIRFWSTHNRRHVYEESMRNSSKFIQSSTFPLVTAKVLTFFLNKTTGSCWLPLLLLPAYISRSWAALKKLSQLLWSSFFSFLSIMFHNNWRLIKAPDNWKHVSLEINEYFDCNNFRTFRWNTHICKIWSKSIELLVIIKEDLIWKADHAWSSSISWWLYSTVEAENNVCQAKFFVYKSIWWLLLDFKGMSFFVLSVRWFFWLNRLSTVVSRF